MKNLEELWKIIKKKEKLIKVFFMIDLIKEIQNTLSANCLRVALDIALTLPDICSQVKYPKIKSVGERYSKRCNTYLRNQ